MRVNILPSAAVFCWCAWRHTFQTVKVPNPLGSGKDTTEGKDVRREKGKHCIT